MTTLKPPHDPIEGLGQAYELMLERVIKQYREAKSSQRLHHLIDQARDKAVELGELGREDAEKLADYLKRDLYDAAEFLSGTGAELKDWLAFKTEQVEAYFLELFIEAADQTTVELKQLREEAALKSLLYRTGEMTGIGTLKCSACGELLHFHKAGHIPPCPKCHATEFTRAVSGD